MGLEKERFLNKIKSGASGCWDWIAAKNKKGYGYIKLRKKRKNEMAHRMSWLLFKGDIPNGLYVLHKCDNPSCVNPDHLFLGTQNDNMKDMAKKGRATGNKIRNGPYPNSKLNWEKVTQIRKSEKKRSILAKKYNVDFSTIYNIQKNKTWK